MTTTGTESDKPSFPTEIDDIAKSQADGRTSNVADADKDLGIITERLLRDDDTKVLYHYCSTSTLLKVLESRSLRFSDLTRLNDAQEKTWPQDEVVARVISRLRSGRGVPEDFHLLSSHM